MCLSKYNGVKRKFLKSRKFLFFDIKVTMEEILFIEKFISKENRT